MYVALLLLVSCNAKQVVHIKNEHGITNDSVMLCRQDSTIIIQIGERLNPEPIASQIFGNETTEMYIMLDENKLFFFDLLSGKLVRTQKIEGCGKLNNYSGFLYMNDTTFVYNYKSKNVYMLDSVFDIKLSWNIKDKSSKYPVDPEALVSSPILYCDGKIMLSGSGLGQSNDATSENKPVSCSVDLKTNEVKYGAGYPEQYRNADFGGVYFNTVYHSVTESGNYVYSFPADHFVYVYSSDFTQLGKYYMGSRYVSDICSSDIDSFTLFKEKRKRIEYYVSQPSYANIIYDKYRNLYYRIVRHPLKNWTGGNFIKPFSIIVMNANGQVISETPIVNDFSELNLHNMHISKDGLLIQKRNSNENLIEFVVYKIVGHGE